MCDSTVSLQILRGTQSSTEACAENVSDIGEMYWSNGASWF